jgi:hypothetical protein
MRRRQSKPTQVGEIAIADIDAFKASWNGRRCGATQGSLFEKPSLKCGA